jgi:hypothetical protein
MNENETTEALYNADNINRNDILSQKVFDGAKIFGAKMITQNEWRIENTPIGPIQVKQRGPQLLSFTFGFHVKRDDPSDPRWETAPPRGKENIRIALIDKMGNGKLRNVNEEGHAKYIAGVDRRSINNIDEYAASYLKIMAAKLWAEMERELEWQKSKGYRFACGKVKPPKK